MIGSTLAKALTMLKAELGTNLTIGTADDMRYYQMIETQQEWLASMYDWNQLRDKWDVTVNARYATIPVTTATAVAHLINFDREVLAWVKYSSNWQSVGYGIGVEEYNVQDSENGETLDPVQKWAFKPGDRASMEVWPVPVTAQEFRFTGQRELTTLRTATVLDPAKTLDLDDRLVILHCAVDILSAKEDPSAKAKSEKLNSLWQTLRAAESKSSRSFPMGSGQTQQNIRKVVPITVG